MLVEHLSKNSNYDIYDMDRHMQLSSRYQRKNTSISEEQQLISPPKEKFYACDIIDKHQRSSIIQDNQIDIIIHLAAILEIEAVEKINHINCYDTNILFDIATKQEHVEMMIYASSLLFRK